MKLDEIERARLDIFPKLAWVQLARILRAGRVLYGPNAWARIDPLEHLDRALKHITAFLKGDLKEDHAGHAACRIVMFLDTLLTAGYPLVPYPGWPGKAQVTRPDEEGGPLVR